MLDLGHQKVYFSRDIIYHENVFPYVNFSIKPLFFPDSSPFTYEDLSPLSEPTYTPDTPTESSHNEGSDVISETPPLPQSVRKSLRPHKSPSYLQDYVHSVHKEPFCFATLINLSIQPLVLPVHCLHLSSQQLLDILNFTEP